MRARLRAWRYLGQNDDGGDDGDARRRRPCQIEVGSEHLRHQTRERLQPRDTEQSQRRQSVVPGSSKSAGGATGLDPG